MNRNELLKTISEVVKSCNVCQASKPRRGAQLDTLEIFTIPEFSLSSISVDFVPMPELDHHSKQYNSNMVVVWRLTGYIIALPCNSKLSSAELAALFLERVVPFMELPHDICSGYDTTLRASYFHMLMKLSGAEDHKSTVYNPKANGMAERAVQSLVQSLRQIMDAWTH